MKVFLASIYAQAILNPYISWRGWQAIPPNKVWRIPFIVLFIVELLLYFTGYIFYKSLPDGIMVFILNVCGTWYISMLYLAMMLLGIEVIRLSNRIHKWFPKWVTTRWKPVKLTLFFVVILCVCFLMINARNTVMNPVVKHIRIDIPQKEGNKYDSLTMVMMSDIHIGEIIDKKLIQQYVSLANQQNPDLIVLVGDLLDYDLHTAEKEHIDNDLRLLNSSLGIYAVNGNHEYRANRFSKWKWIEGSGITLLKDSVILIDNSFYLIGRDDYINRGRRPLQALTAALDSDKPQIMLDHQPRSFVEATMNDMDLGLYGHTHDGQFWPYSLVMKFVYKCAYGYYKRGNSQFYVSSGTGVAGPPYRIGTISEIVVLHIRFIP